MNWSFTELNDAIQNLSFEMGEPGTIKLTQCMDCLIYFKPYIDLDHPSVEMQTRYCIECYRRRCRNEF